MATDTNDPGTLDLLAPPRRGRPRKVDALTPAEKQSRYRKGYRACRRRLEMALAAYDASPGDVHAQIALAERVRALLEYKPR